MNPRASHDSLAPMRWLDATTATGRLKRLSRRVGRLRSLSALRRSTTRCTQETVERLIESHQMALAGLSQDSREVRAICSANRSASISRVIWSANHVFTKIWMQQLADRQP